MKKVVLAYLLAFALLSCKKEDNNNDTSPFSGISYRDEQNSPTGAQDPDDWTFGNPTAQAKNLFYPITDLSYSCAALPDSVTGDATAYPNPATTIFHFGIKNKSGLPIDIRLVDKHYGVISSLDSIHSEMVAFNTSGFTKDQIYRVYYRVVNGKCAYIGYGDVLLK